MCGGAGWVGEEGAAVFLSPGDMMEGGLGEVRMGSWGKTCSKARQGKLQALSM